MADATKQFVKKNSDLIPAGEQIQGALLVEGKGGSWRRGLSAASSLGDAVVSARDSRNTKDEPQGEVASWPSSSAFWLVLTDKQLHVFEGAMGSSKVGPGSAHYPHERISDFRFDKKLLISKLSVTFGDGSSTELDVAKQKTQPFLQAMETHFDRS